jgi:predicted ATP-dependent protease
VRRLNRDTTAAVVGHLLGELREENANLPEVLGYLDEIERDILENADDFLQTSHEKTDAATGPMGSGLQPAQRVHEEVARNTIRVETSGAQVGQMNSLSVFSLGGHSFGHPSRITARVRLGRGQVIDIEREAVAARRLASRPQRGAAVRSGYARYT